MAAQGGGGVAGLEVTPESADVDIKNVSWTSSSSYFHKSILKGALDKINGFPKYNYVERKKPKKEVNPEVTSRLQVPEVRVVPMNEQLGFECVCF